MQGLKDGLSPVLGVAMATAMMGKSQLMSNIILGSWPDFHSFCLS